MNWKKKLKLNEGDEVKFVSKFDAGHLGQTERYRYDILNKDGLKVGSIKYVEATSVKAPFSESFSLRQYDENDQDVLFERW